MLLEINKFEKKVIVYLAIVVVLFALLLVYFSYKKNWFTPTSKYYVKYEEGSGITKGSTVTIAGMKIGYVSNVDLNTDDKVIVEIKVYNKYKDRIKIDSVAKVIRPYGIGKKIIQIGQGSNKSMVLKEASFINAKESTEIIDILSGSNLDPYISTLGTALEKIKIVLDDVLVNVDEKEYVKVVDQISKLATNFNQFTLVMGSPQMQDFLKHGSSIFKNVDKSDTADTAKNLNKLSSNLNSFVNEFNKVEIGKLILNLEKLISDMAKISGQMPEITTKSLKVLDESVWVLKGMQESWFLRDHIKKEKKKNNEKKEKNEK